MTDSSKIGAARGRTGETAAMDPVTERVKAHFDASGDAEWDRLTVAGRDRVSFELHRRMLTAFVGAGDRVLEVGAGPGRFTIELARVGARVTATDISDVQLALNESHVRDARCDDHVEARFVLDVRDVDRLGEAPFDAVVAYGGPLSYVFEDAPDAFGRLVRAVRPGGVVVASVMSMAGAARYFFAQLVEELDVYGLDAWEHIMRTGDLRAIGAAVDDSHTCRLFRWREVEELIAAESCTLLAASASNCMSLGDADALARLEADADRWAWFLDWEASMCREPGALDGGTHILFAVSRDR